jgi:importin-7
LTQAEKFSTLQDSDDDDSVMDEDSLLETPLDKMEPYVMFRDSLLSKPKYLRALTCVLTYILLAGLQQEQPALYDSLTKILEPADQQFLQGVIQEAEIRSIAAQQTHEQLSTSTQATGGVPQASASNIGP